MSSFYGGNSGSMINVPIKNVKGSSQAHFINVAELDYGHYNLSGYYKLDSSSQIANASNPIDLLVIQDEATKKKNVTYKTIEDGLLYVHTIIYGVDASIESSSKHSLNDPQLRAKLLWQEF